jgi:hypothetical protein
VSPARSRSTSVERRVGVEQIDVRERRLSACREGHVINGGPDGLPTGTGTDVKSVLPLMTLPLP